MQDKNQNPENEEQNTDSKKSENAAQPMGNARPEYFEELPTEGGKRPDSNEPAKGGRSGNASVEDGGTVEGSSTGSH